MSGTTIAFLHSKQFSFSFSDVLVVLVLVLQSLVSTRTSLKRGTSLPQSFGTLEHAELRLDSILIVDEAVDHLRILHALLVVVVAAQSWTSALFLNTTALMRRATRFATTFSLYIGFIKIPSARSAVTSLTTSHLTAGSFALGHTT